ncbi:MAG TPA: DUF2844 domain-containing protein [Steroidobacteraceae bacterium]|nr:DUF2844 domain-containing protein [Steroidobacteraceae bacterium]
MMKLPRALLLMSAAACFSAPAFAALGGDAISVESDRAAVKGVLRVTPFLEYDMHEIRTDAGTVIHEYVSPQGKVFAISWRGPGLPNLAQLLGDYSAQLAQAVPRPHYNHHHLRVTSPNVIMESDAYLRTLSGRAWVPALLPQNFAAKDIG